MLRSLSPKSAEGPLNFPAFNRASSMPALTPRRKMKWNDREDQLLSSNVLKHGRSDWTLVAAFLPGRTGKQCRERWTNQLDPSLNRDKWTPEEDQMLLRQQQAHGNCWARITAALPGRSPTALKNRWCWLTKRARAGARPGASPAQEPPVDPFELVQEENTSDREGDVWGSILA
jgi:hypothetical protein